MIFHNMGILTSIQHMPITVANYVALIFLLYKLTTMKKKKILISFVVAFVIGAISFLFIFFGRRLFNYTGLSDAFFISGAIIAAVAGLIWSIRSGSFDVLNYGVYRLFESFKKGNTKRWDTALDYKNEQNSKREKNKIIYWPYLTMAGLCFVLAIIFLAIFYSNIG